MTNDVKILIILTISIKGYMRAAVVDVKGAFWDELFTNGEVIYHKIPQGLEEFYEKDVALLLGKTIYGLKKSVMAFLIELLKAITRMGFKQSMADPYLYHKWT